MSLTFPIIITAVFVIPCLLAAYQERKNPMRCLGMLALAALCIVAFVMFWQYQMEIAEY